MSQELEEIFGDITFVDTQGRGTDLLPEFLKNSPNVKALINAILPEFQELNDAQKDVFSTINIFEAVGSQLDDIFGNLLNLPREPGQNDEDYRTSLLTEASKLAGSGEITTVKNAYRDLTEATEITLTEYQPATIILNAKVPNPETISLLNLKNNMDEVRAAGIEMNLTISNDVNPFSFIKLGDAADPSLGFSSLADPTSGGVLGRIIPVDLEVFELTDELGFILTTETGDILQTNPSF